MSGAEHEQSKETSNKAAKCHSAVMTHFILLLILLMILGNDI